MSSSRWMTATLGDVTSESLDRLGASTVATPIYGVDRVAGLTPASKYASKDLSRYKRLQPGMFAYNPMRLNIGSIGYCSSDYDPGVVSPDYVVFRCDTDKLEPEYLKYYIRSPAWSQWTAASGVGSVRVRIYFRELARMPMRLPPLPDQRAIAHILSTLDEKIELDRRMNETLEAMARTLFKSWFLEIDVKRVQVQELIDEKFLEIGDGYRAKNTELGEPGLPFVRAKNLSSGFDTEEADVLHEDSVAKAGRKISQPGDIAFTSKGTIGRFARVSEFDGRFVYSPQVCYWRSLDPARLDPAILYYWMQSSDFHSQVDAVAGQTDMALYVSLRDQRAMEIPVFPKSQQAVAKRLRAILRRQAVGDAESRTLSALRDTLLPKLILGELKVKSTKQSRNAAGGIVPDAKDSEC